jgi:hypothetical protein
LNIDTGVQVPDHLGQPPLSIPLGPLDGYPSLTALAGLRVNTDVHDHRPGAVSPLAYMPPHRRFLLRYP